jgi:hypothetical protein
METIAPDGKPATRDVWLRGLVMFLFMIAFGFGVWVLNFVAIAQFLWLLFARQPNQLIALFGDSLSAWLAEIGRFLTAATEGRSHFRGDPGRILHLPPSPHRAGELPHSFGRHLVNTPPPERLWLQIALLGLRAPHRPARPSRRG